MTGKSHLHVLAFDINFIFHVDVLQVHFSNLSVLAISMGASRRLVWKLFFTLIMPINFNLTSFVIAFIFLFAFRACGRTSLVNNVPDIFQLFVISNISSLDRFI